MSKKYKNYTVLENTHVTDLDSDCTILVHDKTKAKVLLISNNDENKVFSIAFRTPPTDSTGLPHILEHSVLCGSRKFPVKDPFVELLKSSLNTFLNAFTSPDKTTYPCASCNDKDFANLMDVYLDATLYPNIYKYKEIFLQEGWHYELDKKENDITINGVVYNEMKGAYSSPEQVLFRESLASLYPNTCYGISSGGDPDYIPQLTNQELLDFHTKYYHPSNSYIVLYGNMDMEERLSWMDKEYLSNFDYLKIDSTIKEEKPFSKTISKELKYPIGQEEDEKDKCLLSYNISIGDCSDALLWMSNNVLNYVLLSAPGAVLKQKLTDAGIGKAITGGYQDGILQPMFSVISKNCNKEQKDEFIDVIENTFKELVKNGIDKKTLLATINNMEFMYRESDFGGMPKGLVYSMNAVDSWLYDVHPLSHLEVSKIFTELKELVNGDYFEKVIEKYYINNSHKSIVAIVPDKKIASEKEQALKAKLADLKNSMTDSQIQELIDETNNLKKYQATPSTKEEIDTLPVLKRSDIKQDIVPINTKVHELNSIKFVQNDYFTNGIGYLKAIFNIDKLEEKYVPYMGLLVSVLGNVNTKKYDFRELDNEMNIQTGGISFGTDVLLVNKTNDYMFAATVDMKVLFDKIDAGLDLALEIINNSIFDDYKRLKEIIAEQNAVLQNKIIAAGHVASFNRGLSYINYSSKIKDLTGGIAYYQLISELDKNFESEKENISKTLKMLAANVYRKDNLTVSYTSNDEGFAMLSKCADKFNDLSSENTLKYDFEFKKDILNEGFKTQSNVQYVAQCGNFVQNGYEYTGALSVLKTALSTEYLWMKVRVDGGAYGCMCNFGVDGNTFFVSYRDPNLNRTLEVYKNILKFIDDFKADEDEMTKYIIGAMGEADRPLTPSQKGERSLRLYLRNVNEEEILKYRSQTINCTEKDIKALKDLIASVLDENVICVIGNENKIESEKESLKNTLYLG